MLEVVLGVATLDVLIPVAVATAVGTGLTRVLVGGGPIYGVRAFELTSGWELIAFAALGVAAALAGFRDVRVYFPGPGRLGELRALLGNAFPGAGPVEWVRADICRAELLVEIEGVAELS